MRHLELLIKPASGLCNIDCEYCFYKDIMKHRAQASYGRMELSILETIVRKAFEYADATVSFSFQGGEPLLVGIKFYEALFTFIDQYNVNKLPTNVSFQTNGVLINAEWAKLFKKHQALVGISLDGTEAIHNLYRRDYDNRPTFSSVMNAINILKEYEVDFNILTVLTKNVARNIGTIYDFYKEQRFNYLQFIEVLDKDLCQSGKERYSLNNKDYYKFLKDLFTRWYYDFLNGQYISIRLFDNLIHNLMGNEGVLPCFYRGVCQTQNVIEANGNIYSCDFYVTDKYCIGNIQEMGFEDVFTSKVAKDFITESMTLPKKCKECPYLRLCRNGCKRYRVNNQYYYCEAWTEFYKNYLSKLLKISEIIQNNRQSNTK